MPSRVEELNTDLFAQIDLEKKKPSYVKLNHFCMKGGKTDIDLAGTVENLLTDPVIRMAVDADIDFDDVTQMFPLADGITCRGKIGAALKTDLLLSDITNANYGKLRLGGWCKMENVAVFVPKDSIVLHVKRWCKEWIC